MDERTGKNDTGLSEGTSLGTSRSQRALLGVVFYVLAFAVSLSMLRSPGTFDVDIWDFWVESCREHGLVEGYGWRETYINYPPLGVAMLYAVDKFSVAAGIPAYVVEEPEITGFKISLLICLTATSIFFGLSTGSIVLAALIHLGLMLNSVALGYFDIYFAPTLVLAFWALRKERFFLATFFYALSCSIKWQPIMFAPFFFLHVCDVTGLRGFAKLGAKRLAVTAILPGLLVTVPLFAIFGVSILRALHLGAMHTMLSGYALNFNWIYTYFLHLWRPEVFGALEDGVCTIIRASHPREVLLPKCLFYGAYGLALVAHFRREKTFETFLVYGFVGYLSYFIFHTGVHENHLFPAVLFALLLYQANPVRHRLTALLFLVLPSLNEMLFYGIEGEPLAYSRVIGIDLTVVLAALYVLVFLVLYVPAVWGGMRPCRAAAAAQSAAPGR